MTEAPGAPFRLHMGRDIASGRPYSIMPPQTLEYTCSEKMNKDGKLLYCGMKFTSKVALEEHLEMVHGYTIARRKKAKEGCGPD